MASIHDDFLREIAYKLADGEQFQVICPECAKRGFSLKREAGRLLYHCFKAGCGFSGAVALLGYAVPTKEELPQEERLTPYTGPLQFLDPEEVQALATKFQISETTIRQHVDKSIAFYILPILGPTGGLRGRVRRVPWIGVTPKSICRVKEGVPKSQIFKEKHEPVISWYSPAVPLDSRLYWPKPREDVILVEDQMSAIKLADCGYTACALLGTGLSSEKVAEIQSVSKHIVIALDSDATATAFKLARKWQSAFKSCRVAVLTKDPKDMTREEIHQKFRA